MALQERWTQVFRAAQYNYNSLSVTYAKTACPGLDSSQY